MNPSEQVIDASAASGLSGFFKHLFAGDFMPHGQCLLWQEDLIWLHVGSDIAITLSYYAIPLMLVYFVWKRKDVPFHWMFIMFGIFIVACGTTHLMGIITIWNGAYRIEGLVKLITAAASVGTTIALIPILPKALALPSQAVLNTHYKKKSEALQQANSELEQFNEAVVGRENRVIELKKEVNELMLKMGQGPKYAQSMDL